MMGEDHWYLDGEEVEQEDYEDAVTSTKQFRRQHDPSTSAMKSKAATDNHLSVHTGEKIIPGQYSHYHLIKPGEPNIYTYVNANPWTAFDPEGLDTYTVNRKIGGGPAKPRNFWNTYSHTYTVTTNPDGSVANTYSWGNSANTHGWNKNQPEDIKAAKEALEKGYAKKEGDSSMDSKVDKAYDKLNKKENEHSNGGLNNNCKSETQKLLNTAKEAQKEEQSQTPKNNSSQKNNPPPKPPEDKK